MEPFRDRYVVRAFKLFPDVTQINFIGRKNRSLSYIHLELQINCYIIGSIYWLKSESICIK